MSSSTSSSTSSEHQLYQKTMEGFLASLNRIGEPQPDRSSASPAASGQSTRPDTQDISPLGDREAQLLAEAVADIEQMLQAQQPELF